MKESGPSTSKADNTIVVRTTCAHLWTGILGTGVGMTGLLYLAFGDPWSDPSFPQDGRIWVAVLMSNGTAILFLFMSLFLVWAWCRGKLEMGPACIKVHGIGKDREIKWQDITSVEMGRQGRLQLSGSQKIVLHETTYSTATRREIGRVVCDRVAGQTGRELPGWNAPWVRIPSPKVPVSLVLSLIWGLNLAAAIPIVFSFLDEIRSAGFGIIFSLMGASVGTWAAVRMKSWKVASGAVVAWALLALAIWRIVPLFRVSA